MNILIGSVGKSDYDGCVSPVYYVFRAKDNTDLGFINYLFQMREFQRELRKYANGILEIRLRVSASDILKRMIAVPPLDEQKRIAAFLDEKCAKIDALRGKIETQIEKLDELKKSTITEAVTKGLKRGRKMKTSGVEWIGDVPEEWKITNVRNEFTFSKGLNITKENLVESGIQIVSYGQIHSKDNASVFLKDSLLRYVSEDIAYLNTSARLNKGDFVFADTSEDVEGAGNFVCNNREDVVFAGYHDLIARPKEPRNSHYLSYLFLSDAWRSQIRSRVQGIKVYSITQKVLKPVTIILPPLPEQKEIAEYLDKKCAAIDAAKEKCRAELEKLAEYKKSLIYEYVTGKREVR